MNSNLRDGLKILAAILVIVLIALAIVGGGNKRCQKLCAPNRYQTIGRELTCLCQNPDDTIYFPKK